METEENNKETEEVTESPKIQEQPTEKNSEKKREEENVVKKDSKFLVIITVALIIILIGLLGFLVNKKYPNIANTLTNNKYGFDYNINNVKSHDWDILLTDKKIARALGTAEKNILSAKNPDYAWILTEPDMFANSVVCGPIIDQQVLNEEDNNNKSLLSINVTICANTIKTTEFFDSRKEDTNSIASEENGIAVNKLEDVDKFGTDAYYYLIEKKSETPEDGSEQKPSDFFAGLIFKRGPFVVQLEDSETSANGMKISDDKFRNTIAEMIDTGIKRSLSAF